MPKKRPRASPARGGELDVVKFKRSWWPAVPALAVFVLLAAFGGLEGAADTTSKLNAVRLAQRADQPSISVAPTIVAEPASQVFLVIQVGPPQALPKKSFISLRGLPPSVSLTDGHAIGPGSWAIPLVGLSALKANIPAGLSGRTEIVIGLIGTDGGLLAEARTALVVGPAAMMVPAAKAPVEPQPKRASVPAPVLSAEDTGRGEQLVAQGDRYLAQGKVAGARLFFRQAADIGFAVGAIRLAATYDPAELSRLQVVGIAPDQGEARKWYERARELGAPEAEQRLARLGGK